MSMVLEESMKDEKISMKDEKIQKNARRNLEKKGFYHIEISVKDGIAHLKGTLNDWNDVVRAGRCAGELKEVKEVTNDITVKDISLKKKIPTKKPRTLPERADIVIVGGGITGCFIARELSKFNLDIVLLEKESDVACGATKANNAQIHTGIGEASHTVKKELCRASWPLYDKISEELDVPFVRNGLIVVVTKNTLRMIPFPISYPILKYVLPFIIAKRGKDVGDNPRILKKEELIKMEPHLTDKAVSAVFMPGYGIICPYKLTIALAENALLNGAHIFLETEVTDILVEGNAVRRIVTNRGDIETSFVVNAAGVYADEVAQMAGAREYTIHPRKGCILLFDKAMEGYVHHQVSEVKIPQDPHTKGGGILMTVDGNINWGPSAVEVPDKEDTSVTYEDVEHMILTYNPLFPDFPVSSVITYFSGVRAATYKEDFVIKASQTVRGFIHAAGIQSPGLTAAPKIAERVIEILRNEGLLLKEKEFNPVRVAPPVFSKLSKEEKTKLIEKNPMYGNVVCRCEHVTEAEILNAIHSPLPASTMDAVKRRTRAGMGRCQGGFCGPRVAAILARELKIPPEAVTKEGEGSHLFVERKGIP